MIMRFCDALGEPGTDTPGEPRAIADDTSEGRGSAPLPPAGRGRGWGSTRTESRSTRRFLQHAIGTHMRPVCRLPPVRFNHVDLHLRTPTPDLESSKLDSTPQGGGERAVGAVNSRISSAIALRASPVGKGITAVDWQNLDGPRSADHLVALVLQGISVGAPGDRQGGSAVLSDSKRSPDEPP
jgi:hypothetical protein